MVDWCRFQFLACACVVWSSLLTQHVATAKIHENFDWLKNTEWNWNQWRHVVFRADGIFDAPTPECEAGHCTWSATKKKVKIHWGQAGLHTLSATNAQKKVLRGIRDADGESCSATFVQKLEDESDVDLYEVLGVDEEATNSQIRSAYRKLSVQYHPDKCGTAECAKMFDTIRNANEVLGDEDYRILYDTGGMEAVEESKAEEQRGGGRGGDMFSQFFGGQQRGAQDDGKKKRKGKKGPDANVDLDVSLADMYNGNEVAASINRRVVCRGCKNKKSEKCDKCGRCPNEVKMVLRNMGGFQIQQQEEVASKEKCRDEDTILNAVVEKGVLGGHQLTFERMSEQRPGEIPGDIIMSLRQKPHHIFQRQENDLHMEMKISLKEALLGFTRTVVHLDGHEVKLTANKVTKPMETQKIKGEGMPFHNFPSQFGDLYVKMKVDFPSALSDLQKQVIEDLAL
jgi:DnaJ-class molecular chaperone